MKTEKQEHRIGEGIDMDLEVAKGSLPAVERLEGKSFAVASGSSCTMCDFTGLGHVLCPHISCSSGEREDGKSVVYKEVEPK